MRKQELQLGAALKTILIVDDEKPLAEAVAATLDQDGWQTIVVHDGEQALAAVRAFRPDLIILDVMMPGITGVEVCETLKQEPRTASIPIVLVTAKAQLHEQMEGLAAGADEYLTKPFSPTELITLVNRLLAGESIKPRVRRPTRAGGSINQPDLATMAADQLMVYARELRDLAEQERSQRRALEEAQQRLDELDQLKAAFLSATTHELLTPFSTIGLTLEILQRENKDLPPSQRGAVEDLAAEIAGLYQMIKGVVRFSALMNKRRKPQQGYYALQRVIPGAIQPVAMLAQSRQVDFRCVIPPDLPQAYADPELLGEAVFQMAHNAVKFNKPGGQATVRCYQSDGCVVIEVSDTGVGLTVEQLAAIGRPFEQSADAVRRGREGLGIGLAFVRYVAEVHDGRTFVKSPGPGQGSTFYFALQAVG